MSKPLPTLAEIYREQCKRSLYAFVRQFWSVVEPAEPFVDSLHIKALCDHVQAVIEGRIKDLSIEIGPGYAKSLITAVFMPAWAWGPLGRPKLRFGFSTYANELTVRDSRRCRDLINSPHYQELWGHVYTLKTDGGNRQDYYETNAKGFRLATSTKGAATGHRFHFFVGDDLINSTDAQSEAERIAVKEHLRAMSSRGVNQSRYGQIIIGQRLHEDDAGGWARAAGFEVLCLPTEYDPARHCETSIGFKDWRTTLGELLFPQRFGPNQVIEAKLRLGPIGYSAQHQQLPVPAGGGVLELKWFKRFVLADLIAEMSRKDRPKKPFAIYQSWDTAYTENIKNDSSACTTWHLYDDGIYLVDAWYGHLKTPPLIEKIKELARKHKPTSVLIEAKANGLPIIDTLNLDSDFPFHIEEIKVKHGKDQRAHAAAPYVARGWVHLPDDHEYTEQIESQVRVFPAGKLRDLADSIVQAVLHLCTTYTFNNSLLPVYEAVDPRRPPPAKATVEDDLFPSGEENTSFF